MAENDTEESGEKVEYTKSTAAVDLETRLAADNDPQNKLQAPVNPGYGDVESGNLYLGTNPEYQNHANDTEAPYQADDDESADALAEASALGVYDSREVKEEAADLDEHETLDAQEGVSPVAHVPDGLEKGSPLVVESPPSGETVENEEYEDEENPAPTGGFTGGTGGATPSTVTPPSPGENN